MQYVIPNQLGGGLQPRIPRGSVMHNYKNPKILKFSESPILIRDCIADVPDRFATSFFTLSLFFHGMTQNVLPQYKMCHAMEHIFVPESHAF